MAYRRSAARRGSYSSRRRPARRVSSYSARRGRTRSGTGYRRSGSRARSGREIRIVVEQRNAAPVMPVGVTDAGPTPRARF